MKRICTAILLVFIAYTCQAVDVEGKKVAVKVQMGNDLLVADVMKMRQQGIHGGSVSIPMEKWAIESTLQDMIIKTINEKLKGHASVFASSERLPVKPGYHNEDAKSVLSNINTETDYILLVYPGWVNLGQWSALGYGLMGYQGVKPTAFIGTEFLLFDTRKKLFVEVFTLQNTASFEFSRHIFVSEQEVYVQRNFKDASKADQETFRQIVSKQPVNMTELEAAYRKIYATSATLDDEVDYIKENLQGLMQSVTIDIMKYRESEIEKLYRALLSVLDDIVTEDMPNTVFRLPEEF